MRTRWSRLFAVMITLAVLLPGPITAKGQESPLQVTVDQRVELMSIIFRLAGNPEYNQGRLTGYLKDIDSHFAAHRDHDVIRTARRLRQTRGVSFDAVMSMAVHVSDAFELKELTPFDAEQVRLDRRWRLDEAREFLEQAREFVKVSEFRRFMEEHRALHTLAGARMQVMIQEHGRLAWFDSFFGARPQASFAVIPAPVNGGQAYGPSVRLDDGTERLYAIIGVWQMDAEGQPRFDTAVLPTVIHEFCHSYVNHVVEGHAEALRPAGEQIFPLVERAMRRQAYGNWRTMVNESVVRASVVRFLMAHDPPAAQRQLEEEKSRGFLWIASLVSLLGEYEDDRAQWPTFEQFMPRIVRYFDELAPKLRERMNENGEEK